MEQIEFQKLNFEGFVDLIRTFKAKEIDPLKRTSDEHFEQFLITLDKALETVKVSVKHKAALSEFFSDNLFQLIADGRPHLQPLHDKYSEVGYAEAKTEQNSMLSEMFKEMIEKEMGIDFEIDEDIDWTNQEQVMAFLHEKMKKLQDEAETKAYQKKINDKQKKKSNKAVREETDETEIQKLTRSIYLELVKQYHPDKVQSEKEKEANAEVMKRLTQAYEDQNLLDLFKLQLEFSNTPIEALDVLANDKLRLVNKTLQTKINAMKFEIKMTENQIREDLHLYNTLSKQTLEYALKNQVKNLKSKINAFKNDIAVCKSGKKGVQAMASSIYEFIAAKEDEDIFFFDL